MTSPSAPQLLPPRLDQQFVQFSKYGDTRSDGRSITLTNLDKWFKQAEVINKKLTMTDTGVSFNKFKSRTINYPNFLKLIEDLSAQKDIPVDEIKEKLQTCGVPGAKKKAEEKK